MSIGRPISRGADHTRFDELQEAIVADYRVGKLPSPWTGLS